MARQNKDTKPPTFEKTLAEVEEIVESLEQGDLGLEESLAAYEKGVKRLKRCQEILAKAERRIAVLSGTDAEGNPVTQPMEGAEAPEPDDDPNGGDEENALF